MSVVNYRNGNYVVYFDTETGDKTRNTHDTEYKPKFAENCDVTITEYCDGGCPYCYAGCSTKGKHGDLNAAFLKTLHPYTELAINGNDLSHPDLEDFLTRMKAQGVIVNMTVNQKHLVQHYNKIIAWQNDKLVHGVGVSYVMPDVEFLQKVVQCPKVVVHVIEGIVTASDIEYLAGHNLNILILGYKTTGRGAQYVSERESSVLRNSVWLKNNLKEVFQKFESVSFDNLALEHLDVRLAVTDAQWEHHYMGEDGDFTFFINLVDGYFAKNSTSAEHYPLMDSVDEMFAFIQNKRREKL